MACRQGSAFTNESTKLSHFGQNHRNDFKSVDFFIGELAGVFGLNHEHAELFTKALDWHAEEA